MKLGLEGEADAGVAAGSLLSDTTKQGGEAVGMKKQDHLGLDKQ